MHGRLGRSSVPARQRLVAYPTWEPSLPDILYSSFPYSRSGCYHAQAGLNSVVTFCPLGAPPMLARQLAMVSGPIAGISAGKSVTSGEGGRLTLWQQIFAAINGRPPAHRRQTLVL